MPFDLADFNGGFREARFQIREHGADIAAEQARLRQLIPADTSPADRAFAEQMVDELAKPPPAPRTWGPEYHEAGQIASTAYATFSTDGTTTDEKIAVLEEARRQIFAIARGAPEDEAPHIRAMTRPLEHLERDLREPPDWLELPDRPDDSAGR